MKNIYKIAIVGGPGTGKSTLADNLSRKLELPVYHLDGIHFLENWKSRDKSERDQIIMQKIQEPKWIIDGTYISTLEQRIQKSDLIIFMDYSTIVKLKSIVKRYIKNKGKEKEEIPGCKEKIDMEFIRHTMVWNKNKKRIVCELLAKYKHKNILVFKSRKGLNKWYEDKFKEKIKIK